MRRIKTDEVIKEFIDSKEALTKIELSKFIYGYKTSGQKGNPILIRWWIYALETKDWAKLKEYQKKKINDNNESRRVIDLEIVKRIYNTDPRVNNCGFKKFTTILKNVYGYKVSVKTVGNYLKQIRGIDGITN